MTRPLSKHRPRAHAKTRSAGSHGLIIGFSMLVLIAAMVFAGAARADKPKEIFAPHDPASVIAVDHSAFKTFLDSYLVPSDSGVNLVRYGAVTPDDHQALKTYIVALGEVDPATLNRDEQFAFWANLYNAVTIDVILDEYPVDSIREITNGFFSFGPWKIKRFTVNGVLLSLHNVEHDIMREVWDDPRVHYAVNCASMGCPNLLPEPFTGANLDEALNANARAYINHPRGAEIRDGDLYVSTIYRWFDEDFGDGSDKAVIQHLMEYAEPDLRRALAGFKRIDGYRYDWSLNEPAN